VREFAISLTVIAIGFLLIMWVTTKVLQIAG